MISRDRYVQQFLELVRIDSHSRKEGAVMRRLQADLEALGARVEYDAAGTALGGEVGNLIARVPGTRPAAPPLFLNAHVDTVVPGEGVKPRVEGDVIRTDGTTVLGADDKSGVAVIVEVLRALKEDGVPHGELEVVFTICEEVGLLGAKHLDYGRLLAREGISLDSDGPEEIIAEAPAACRLEFRVHGLAAHAGVRPEAGVSAIRIAAEAIARMRLGRLDHESTANIGVIEGGKATNIISDFALVKAEARSHNERKLARQVAHMRRRFQHAARRHRVARDGEVVTGRVEDSVAQDYPRLRLAPDLRIVQLIREAGRRLGREVGVRRTGGGLDANIFNNRGITVATFGTGQHEIHTLNEYLNIPESLRAAELMLECIRLNATAA
jgi:tripeptide aminopeptidase